MKKEHAAIIARARRDGISPVELAHELMGYTLVEAMRDAAAATSVPYAKMSEIQQDSAIQQWSEAVKEAIDLAIQVIASAGTRTVRMDLTSVAVGKKLKVAGVVAGTEEYKHDLIDLANDQGTAIVILNERDYLQGLDGIHGEKDQKALQLDGAEPQTKPAKKSSAAAKSAGTIAKEVVLAPKLIEQARQFVIGQQNTTLAGMQNQFKVGADKARAVFAALVESGDVVASEGLDKWELVRKATDDMASPGDAADNKVLSMDLYAAIKASVIKRGVVSAGVIMIEHSVSEEIALAAIDQLEDEGVVTEEDEIGGRSVNAAETA